MELETLVQIVGRSLVQLQSMTQPASFEELGSLWWFRNATSQNVLLSDQEVMPSQIIVAARDVGIAGRIVIHQFLLPETDDVDLIQCYERQGFQLQSRQYLMQHTLKSSPNQASSWRTWRVENIQQAKQVSSAAKQKLLTEQHLPPAPLGVRLYAAQASEQVIAWGRITQVQPEVAWVSDLFTRPGFRKRGVMTALMHEYHRDALAFEAQHMLLLSSVSNFDFHFNNHYKTVAVKLRFVPQPGVLERFKDHAKAIMKKAMGRARF
jgi:GNAT superfamily N-acetyltransferase